MNTKLISKKMYTILISIFFLFIFAQITLATHTSADLVLDCPDEVSSNNFTCDVRIDPSNPLISPDGSEFTFAGAQFNVNIEDPSVYELSGASMVDFGTGVSTGVNDLVLILYIDFNNPIASTTDGVLARLEFNVIGNPTEYSYINLYNPIFSPINGHYYTIDLPSSQIVTISLEPVCGDNVIEGIEGCDDGNIVSDDGCSSTCVIESGWVCNDEPSVCNQPELSCSDNTDNDGDSYIDCIDPDCTGDSACTLPILIGHWPLDNDIQDNSGYGFHGSLINSPSPISGIINEAYDFESADGIDVGYINYSVLDGFSVSFWAKRTVNNNNYERIIAAEGGTGDKSWYILTDNQQSNYKNYYSSLFRVSSPPVYSTPAVSPTDNGVWAHYVMTFSGSELKWYKNGTLEDIEPFSGTLDSTTANTQIGRSVGVGVGFNGAIDDVRIYEGEIGLGLINDLYQLGVPPPLPPACSSTNPLACNESNCESTNSFFGWYDGTCYDARDEIDFSDNNNINQDDTTAFITELESNYSSQPASGYDLNGDGVLNFADIKMYISLYYSATD